MTRRFRRALVVGNWKMHLTVGAAVAAVRELLPLMPAVDDREVVLAPPFLALAAVGGLLTGTPVKLAAQDLFWEDEGPYTGEVSAPMLAEVGALFVITGHSERRLYLGESDRMVGHKVRAALRGGLRPIVCVGEDQEARDAGRAGQVVRDQLLRSLEEAPREEAGRIAVAYEPVWAIGTGRSASPADAAEMHALIRLELETILPPRAADSIRILYGGSVTGNNIDELMGQKEIDGVLVGGASLHPREFARIARFNLGDPDPVGDPDS